MKLPSISVIIPAFNAQATIRETLLSIALQSVPPLEAIVIDDGSTDGTVSAAEACRGEMRGVELILLSQAHLGPGAARNLGLKTARGELAAFLDADDAWLPGKIEQSLLHLQDHVLVAHDFIELNGALETLRDPSRHFLQSANPYETLFERCYIATSTVLARREALLSAGGFALDLPAAQDYDLWLRLLGRPGASFSVFALPLMRYRVSPLGVTSQVERRRACSMEVLVRNLALLGKAARGVAFRRVLIIHYEAMMAHRSRGEGLGVLSSLASLPVSLLRIVPAKLSAPLASLWVLAVLSAYYLSSGDYYAEKLSVFGRFLWSRL
jgi:glycosyltransferase involved in cell wall biosynthesis